MGYNCKFCLFSCEKRSIILHHYRIKHGTHGRLSSLPCVHATCCLVFKTFQDLRLHLSHNHNADGSIRRQVNTQLLTCSNCKGSERTIQDFLRHLRRHLRSWETVACPFKDCTFASNVAATFRCHQSRNHSRFEISDFKHEVVGGSSTEGDDCNKINTDGDDVEYDDGDVPLTDDHFDIFESETNSDVKAVPPLSADDMLKYIASVLLKMQVKLNLSQNAIQEILQDINSIHDLSMAEIRRVISMFLSDKSIDTSIAEDLSEHLYSANPLIKHTLTNGKFRGTLSTHKRRQTFFKNNFPYVGPVEYSLGICNNRKCSFVYVPIIPVLQQLLSNADILDKVLNVDCNQPGVYSSFRDGEYFKANKLFNGEDLSLQIGFYYDDFECVNPIGTSRKKHKIGAFYWVFTNLPAQCRSSLHAIQLATLCRAEDVKHFGLEQVLQPFLRDVAFLEQHGVHVASLGQSIKGTISYISCDNLGAHTIGGFLQSFSRVTHVCRFCMASSSDIQDDTKCIESFEIRTQLNHLEQVALLSTSSSSSVCGIRSDCVLHQYLTHFHVTQGLPPDIAHDLLEGIVPHELALCLNGLIHKKCFSLEFLNSRIRAFPYLHSDRVNQPQIISNTFGKNETVGGNVAENWTLLRMLPFLIGDKVDESELLWLVLMELKDIVEIVFAPILTEELIANLDSKIGYHRRLLREAFPDVNIKPKAHYLEHYPQLIRCYGPLSLCWTLRFEGKHSFFKKVVRRAANFKNLLRMLAERHQLNLTYHLGMPNFFKSAVEAFQGTEINICLMSEEVKSAVEHYIGSNTSVTICKYCIINGVKYTKGLNVAVGVRCGIVQFAQIVEIILGDSVIFLTRTLNCEYLEHLRCIEIVAEGDLRCITSEDISFYYPLPSYKIGHSQFIMPKYFMCLNEGENIISSEPQ